MQIEPSQGRLFFRNWNKLTSIQDKEKIMRKSLMTVMRVGGALALLAQNLPA